MNFLDRETAAKKAAVFIDIESFGNMPSKDDGRRYLKSMARLFDGIPKTLGSYGIVPTHYWAVARAQKPRPYQGGWKTIVSPQRQVLVSDAFLQSGVSMSWCRKTIADTAIITEIKRRASERVLPGCVVLMTNDGDFAGTARQLMSIGYFVVVIGHQQSRRWDRSFNAFISAYDLVS